MLVYAIGLAAEEDKWASKAKRALGILVASISNQVFTLKGVAELDSIAHQVALDIRKPTHHRLYPSNIAVDETHRQIKLAVKNTG